MEGRKRLSAEDRKHEILMSSMQVFAKKGFDGATSRELAEAAGVSEALLYKYFPTKAVLYGELAGLLGSNKERLVGLMTQQPAGAEGFVRGFYFLSRLILLGRPNLPKDQTIDRLIGQSLLGDGSFAEAFLENMFHPVVPYFLDCLAAAGREGHLVCAPKEPELQCHLFHHFIGTLALFSLPSRKLIPAPDQDELLQDALLFAFRGAGLTDTAISKLVDFERLDQAFLEALGGKQNHEPH